MASQKRNPAPGERGAAPNDFAGEQIVRRLTPKIAATQACPRASPSAGHRGAHMNARAARRVDRALVSACAKAVYSGRELAGHIHPSDAGWIAEGPDGRILGSFAKEKAAVGAVLNASIGRRT